MIFINLLTTKIFDFILPCLGHSSFDGKTVEFDEGTIFISKSDAFADWDKYDHFKINGLGILITDKKSVACNRVSVHFLQIEDADKIVETFRRVFHKSFFEKIAEKFINTFLFGMIENCDIINSGGFSIERTIKFMQHSGEAVALFGEGETPAQALINAVQTCENFNQWRMVLLHFTGNKSVVNNSNNKSVVNNSNIMCNTAGENPLIESLFHREAKIRWAKTIDNNAETVKIAVIAACHESNLKRIFLRTNDGGIYIIGRG